MQFKKKSVYLIYHGHNELQCIDVCSKVRIFGFRQCIVMSSRYKAFLSLSWDGGARVSVSLCVWKGKWKEGKEAKKGKGREGKGKQKKKN